MLAFLGLFTWFRLIVLAFLVTEIRIMNWVLWFDYTVLSFLDHSWCDDDGGVCLVSVFLLC